MLFALPGLVHGAPGGLHVDGDLDHGESSVSRSVKDAGRQQKYMKTYENRTFRRVNHCRRHDQT